MLNAFVERTRMGRAMRATSQDPDVARLMGIDPDRVIVLTFVLGAALAGIGGVLYGDYLNNINIDMGFQNGIFAFTAAVLGGIGNIRGAVVGGIAIGLVKSLGGPVPARRHGLRLRLDLRGAHRGAGVPAAGLLRRDRAGAGMTIRRARRLAPAGPSGRLAPLAPYSLRLRVAGGVLT